jgi:hypothetical protein
MLLVITVSIVPLFRRGLIHPALQLGTTTIKPPYET